MVPSRRVWGAVTGAFALVAALLLTSVSSVSPASAAEINDLGAGPPPVSRVSTKSVFNVSAARKAASTGPITRQDMLNAQPADMPDPSGTFDVPSFEDASSSAATGDFTPGNVTAFPQRIHGKIFFKVGANTYSCSGTVVDSRNRDVVFTAGHCVYDLDSGQYVNPIVFLPAYENGNAPLGEYYGSQWFTTESWALRGDQSYDLGIIKLERPIQGALGSRQIAFDLNMNNREVTIFGYPSKPSPPFDGEILRGCRSAIKYVDDSKTQPYPLGATPCTMQQGSSGGGWIALGNYLSSVVSYGYCDSNPAACGVMFGPVFSNAAKALYQALGGSPNPTVRLKKAPPAVVRKRKVTFAFTGTAATLIGFRCKLDRQRTVNCASKISITRLRPGKHTLRVWAIDQTGKLSKKQLVRKFRVVLPRR